MRDHRARRRSLRLPMSPDRRNDSRISALTPGVRAACFLLLACAACPAAAQTSGNLTLVSEYAVRGISLGAGRPALQLRVDHDAPGGWYAGGFVSAAVLAAPGESRRQTELIVYGGRAGRLPSGLSWDAGVSRAAFSRGHEYDYFEFHAGLALDRASVRLFLSPAYYGQDRSAYLDLNAFHPLDERVRLTFHAGLMHAFGDANDSADLRVGLAATLDDWTLQLGWQTLLRESGNGPPRARALTGSAGIRF
jgi:uncharacterized protein (TIGR02001 family)